MACYSLYLQFNLASSMEFEKRDQGRQAILYETDKAITLDTFKKQDYKSVQNLSLSPKTNKNQKNYKSDDPQANSDSSPLKPKKSSKNKKRRSKNQQFSNHNFQKHTVLTVKKLGQKLINSIGIGQAQEVAKRVWMIFISGDINSKKVLLVIFGKANMKKEKFRELFRECYLGQMCSYDQQMVQQAQNILRKSFIELVNDDLIRLHTKKSRNIYHKQEFIAYFLQFVQQLKNGPFVKSRIDNVTKKKIERRIKSQKKLSSIHFKRNKDFVYQQLA